MREEEEKEEKPRLRRLVVFRIRERERGGGVRASSCAVCRESVCLSVRSEVPCDWLTRPFIWTVLNSLDVLTPRTQQRRPPQSKSSKALGGGGGGLKVAALGLGSGVQVAAAAQSGEAGGAFGPGRLGSSVVGLRRVSGGGDRGEDVITRFIFHTNTPSDATAGDLNASFPCTRSAE